MSLGILNNVAALYAENNLNNTSSKLQSTLQQLSSGSRINSGADDAGRPRRIRRPRRQRCRPLPVRAKRQPPASACCRPPTVPSSQVTSLLDRAVTLATESANGTLTSGQVSSANQEYQNILSQIGNIGSTTNYNSTTVFSAKATNIVVTRRHLQRSQHLRRHHRLTLRRKRRNHRRRAHHHLIGRARHHRSHPRRRQPGRRLYPHPSRVQRYRLRHLLLHRRHHRHPAEPVCRRRHQPHLPRFAAHRQQLLHRRRPYRCGQRRSPHHHRRHLGSQRRSQHRQLQRHRTHRYQRRGDRHRPPRALPA